MTNHLKIICLTLSAEHKIDLYDLHIKYALSPFQIKEAVKYLLNNDMAILKGRTLQKTETFGMKLFQRRHEIMMNKSWKKVPPDFIETESEIYYPSKTSVANIRLTLR